MVQRRERGKVKGGGLPQKILLSHVSRSLSFHLCLINPNSITRHRFKPKSVAVYAVAINREVNSFVNIVILLLTDGR